MTLIAELTSHPVTALALPWFVWVWTKILVQEWDYKELTLSYADCIERKQYYRIFTAPCTHRSISNLLINLILFWSCKNVEGLYGSWFMFRYSILLIVAEALLTFVMIKYTLRFGRGEALAAVLNNLHSLGCSGLILAWFSFLSMQKTSSPIIFLGVFPVHPAVAILPTIFINYLFGPVSNVYANLSGLLCGYMLASGLLLVLPDLYWSLCFLLNLLIIAFIRPTPDSSRSGMNDNEEMGIVEVPVIGDGQQQLEEDSSFSSSSSGEEEEEEGQFMTVPPIPIPGPGPAAPVGNSNSISHRIGSMFRTRSQRAGEPEHEEREPLLSSLV